MNVWANAVITEKGLALLAKLTQGNSLDIVDAVVGAGFVTPGVLQKQTEVTSPKQTLKARPVSYPETGKCDLPLVMTNEGVVTGYEATQVGVFANDPDEGKILFFIAQSITADIGTTIPSEKEMPGYSAEWTFRLQYGQADSVSVTVDPSNTISPEEMMAYINAHFGIVNATGDGMDYTASISGVTELKKGMIVTIIPDTTSAATIPTLNLNGLGVKNIKQRLSTNTSLTAEAATDSWMIAGKPVPLMFDGNQWVTITGRPVASTLYGKTDIKNGGTNAETAAEARVNLGAQAQHAAVTVTLLASDWTDDKQTVNVKGATETNTVLVGPHPDSYTEYSEYNVRCTGQGNGTLTFTCESAPSSDLQANVVFLSKEETR